MRVPQGPNPESPDHQGPMMLTHPNISGTQLARCPSVSPYLGHSCLILSVVALLFLVSALARKGRGNDKNSQQTVR